MPAAKVEKQEATPVTQDPWKEMREVYVPRGPRNSEKYMLLNVNNNKCLIEKGKKKMVPAPIAERLRLYFKAAEEEERLQERENAFIQYGTRR